MRGSADADRRHQIIITMIYLERKLMRVAMIVGLRTIADDFGDDNKSHRRVQKDVQGTRTLPVGLLITSIFCLRTHQDPRPPPLTNFNISSLASLQ